MKNTFYIILLVIIFGFTNTTAQTTHPGEDGDLVQFSGMIMTSDSLNPMPFSHIINMSSGFGSISDYDGYFSFVARKNDTIRFSSLGYKDEFFVIPDTIHDKRYTLFQVMTTDTIFLSETVIYPWPSKEDFRDAFLNLEIPEDDYEIAMKNLEQSKIMEGMEKLSYDGAENYDNYISGIVAKNYYKGQFQPITILNPFAWAQFIKAWKEGKFKRREYRK